MSEVILPVYCREFRSSKKLKFVKHMVTSSSQNVIDEFEDEAKQLDFKIKFQEMVLEELGKVRKRRMMIDEKERLFIKCLLEKWCTRFLLGLDEVMEKKVAEAILITSSNRCKIDGVVFNFSSVKEIDEELKKILNLGGNFVVHQNKNEEEARAKLESELLSYVRKYRNCIERKPEINQYYLEDWVQEAIKDSVDPHTKFYADLLEIKQVGLSRQRFGVGSNHDLKN